MLHTKTILSHLQTSQNHDLDKKKLQDITLGQQDCKILGRLTRLWDSKNMRSKSADPLISIDVIIIDENESIFSSYLTLLHIS